MFPLSFSFAEGTVSKSAGRVDARSRFGVGFTGSIKSGLKLVPLSTCAGGLGSDFESCDCCCAVVVGLGREDLDTDLGACSVALAFDFLLFHRLY